MIVLPQQNTNLAASAQVRVLPDSVQNLIFMGRNVFRELQVDDPVCRLAVPQSIVLLRRNAQFGMV